MLVQPFRNPAQQVASHETLRSRHRFGSGLASAGSLAAALGSIDLSSGSRFVDPVVRRRRRG